MKALRVAALAAMVGAASFIVMGAQGCGSELHKASVAAASIGAGVQTAATVNHDLIQSGQETPEEGAAVATYILKVAKANDVFIGDLKVAQASGGQLTSAEIVTDFQAVVDSAGALENAGVLGIKSAQAKSRFATVIAGIKMQIAVIQALIGSPTSQDRHRPDRFPGSPAGLIFVALALTPAEIEELIALAISAGSALATKLMSLRGEPDAQLVASALASDAAAESQAIADGAKE